MNSSKVFPDNARNEPRSEVWVGGFDSKFEVTIS